MKLPPEHFWLNDPDIKRKTHRPDSRLGRGVRAAFVQGFGWESSTTNGTNIHEWGAASPENFLAGIIRVHSRYSWFLFLTTNGTNIHEWGTASPENFLAGIIRVHS
jgi:hypothetical protein